MDSDDDVHIDGDEDAEQDAYYESVGDDSESSKHVQQYYVVLSEADIRQRQEDDIASLSSLLSVTKADCTSLLTHYSWSVTRVHEEWFADEERVRKAVGLFNNPKPSVFGGDSSSTCGICFDTVAKGDIYYAGCGHPFCRVCWGGYMSSSINDGPGCLTLRCPDPSCSAAVGQDMVDALVASEDDRKKYDQHLVRSYVEGNRKTKWCPAPGCEYAVDFVGTNFDVKCGCSYGFCWNCSEEAHRPVGCETVKEWITKNSSESENTLWILANSKPCPMCKRPIEKNHGCMHMTCRPPCRYEFCWICLGNWRNHKACNRYNMGQLNKDEWRRQTAKNCLEKYTHYYERWDANHKSWRKAIADLDQVEKVHMGKLIELQSESEGQLKFLVEAWSQIVECRRFLKWTYAYGYYLPEDEAAKKQLFEYLQGQAEAGLERLHHCAEELQGYLNNTDQGPSEEFSNFRGVKLADLTSVTRNFFENLVTALENGLSEAEGSGGMGQKRRKTSSGPSIGAAVNEMTTMDEDEDEVDRSYWNCDQCTYLNHISRTACQMCHGDD